MARLFITGGAGFIGANFVHHWLHAHPGDRVVVLDALTYAGNRSNLDIVRRRDEFRFVHGDIRDTALVEDILRTERLDTIVHFAAESHVDRSIEGPDAFVSTNVIGTHSMLKAARQVWLEERAVSKHRFHQVSTDEVYGSLSPDDKPFVETTPYAPNSPYAASKAAADHLVRSYHHTYGLEVTTSNCSNNYGPYHFPEKLIPLMIVNILEGKSIPIYGDGLNVRDWLHVSDHCRCIDLILDRGAAGEVYNIGGSSEVQNIALALEICRSMDEALATMAELRERFPRAPARSAELIRFVKDRPGHDRRYAIDCTKAAKDLGFKPIVPLAEGLRGVLNWYLTHEQWWRDVMDGSYRQWVEGQYQFA